VVEVVDARRCNATVTSRCAVVARARVGTSPLAAAIDPATGTVYVVNGGSNTVSVLNGTRCNARVTRGCGRPAATVKVGKFPVAAVVNPATRTLYVANLGGGSISVINAARCNSHVTSGCRRPARKITDRAGPDWLAVNVATDTVYAANGGSSGNGGTVSVINGAACNGHTGRGCARRPPTVRVGGGPFAIAVDQANNTVYVPSNNDGTVSVINGARCNARRTSGCRRTPPTVTTGPGAQFVAVENGAHTVFTVNQGDDTLSAINTRTCRGGATFGCRRRPPSQQATAHHGRGFNSFPNMVALIPQTGSAYVVNVGGLNILSVASTRRCNAAATSGCSARAPAAPVGEFVLSADRATGTIYAGSLSKPRIDVINAATCRARRLSGCAPVAVIPMPDPEANVGSIDAATHTLYASDPFSDAVAVINTATCNARNTSGCAAVPPTITVGVGPGPPAFNPATRTLYVPYGAKASRVAVVNAATCNAQDASGCGQVPAVVRVGQGTFSLAVSIRHDTVYGASAGSAASGFTNGHTVSVINGSACNGTRHSGCGHPVVTAGTGPQPEDVAVNDRTHTAYVTNNAEGDAPGTVSVINIAACNGTVTTGCHRHLPVIGVGISPVNIVLDARTGLLYVSDFSSASVSVLNGLRCNAEVITGCATASHERGVGSLPFALAVMPRTGAVYVTSLFRPGSLLVLQTGRR
jgi:DNA-binding beta-propeller fold protein YncE